MLFLIIDSTHIFMHNESANQTKEQRVYVVNLKQLVLAIIEMGLLITNRSSAGGTALSIWGERRRKYLQTKQKALYIGLMPSNN